MTIDEAFPSPDEDIIAFQEEYKRDTQLKTELNLIAPQQHL
jgi:hypothetical protein